jgi:hypothetical protein
MTPKWEDLVLAKLQEISDEQRASREERARLREDMAALKAQLRFAGAIAGLISGALTALGVHFVTGRK